MTAWLVSTNSRGVTSAWSARTRIGVPCSSDPLTMSTSWPAIRMYRLKTSEGTPNPATWPRWRGPLAYGQATAERTFMGPDPRRRRRPSSRPGPRAAVRDYASVVPHVASSARPRGAVVRCEGGTPCSLPSRGWACPPPRGSTPTSRSSSSRSSHGSPTTSSCPSGYEWIESNWAIGIGAVLLLAEVVLDKIPAVDTVNDTIQTFIRPSMGGLIFAARRPPPSSTTPRGCRRTPGSRWCSACVISGLVHTGKMAARPVINIGTAGTGAPVVSTVEDGASFGLSRPRAHRAGARHPSPGRCSRGCSIWMWLRVRRWRRTRRDPAATLT